MKNLVVSHMRVGLALCAVLVSPVFTSAAADSSAPGVVVETSAQVKLPYGVEDVLKLVRAKVAEETVVSFVQNSGTIYNLQANDIVYLRGEGVSDRVINAMLEQRKRLADSSVQPAAAPVPMPTSPAPAQPADNAVATTQAQPAPVYVQPPATPPPSTVYVVPSPDVYYGYPYYPYYPYYYGPSVSFGFRFGGGHRWGGGWGHGGHR